jgi:hypothetical protein
MKRTSTKKGKLVRGKGDDKGKFVRCPNCNFIIDTTKVPRDQQWHVVPEEFIDTTEYVDGAYDITTESGELITTESGDEIITTEEEAGVVLTDVYLYKPVVSGGCPFCGLGAY